jgi:outer membrane scaffolding protein for murein synthesis (MipA/OmpV family)
VPGRSGDRRAPALAQAALLLLLAVGPGAAANEKPLWELGAGGTALAFPDYRGSDQTHAYVLPIPYVVYRGERLKADRDGVRGILFDRDDVEINASVGASVPVYSAHNDARHGMADLKPTVEFGPAVDLTLWRSPARDLKLSLRTPLRAAFTVERSPEFVGWVFSPRLNLDVDAPLGAQGWTLGLVVSPAWADSRYHRYYYSVPPGAATADRPAYTAAAGYNGTELLGALWKRFDRWWVGAYVRCDSLAGVAFADSPLMRSRQYVAAGFALAWVFAESSERVRAD